MPIIELKPRRRIPIEQLPPSRRNQRIVENVAIVCIAVSVAVCTALLVIILWR